MATHSFTPHKHLNCCTVHYSQAFLGCMRHFHNQLYNLLHLLIMSLVSARRTPRTFRGSLRQLRITGLLNLQHLESNPYCISCSIGCTACACQENPGRVKTRGVRRLHKLQHQRQSSCMPGEPRSSQGPTRSDIAQAAALVTQVVRAKTTLVE